MKEARSNEQRAYLSNDKLRIEGRIYDLNYCIENIKKQEKFENSLRRSLSQQLYGPDCEVRGRRYRRNKSQSPVQRNQSQQEQRQPSNFPAKRNDRRSAGVDDNEAETRGRQEVNFQLGPTNHRSRYTYPGNSREFSLETRSSNNGSIVRINKQASTSQGYYNLRNWVSKKP